MTILKKRYEKSVLIPKPEKADYTNPPIPSGCYYMEGEWDSGYVISDNSGNQYVWVPVGSLELNGILAPNGILDEQVLESCYGRRDYWHQLRGYGYENRFRDKFPNECRVQSLNKYGGFYISRCILGKDTNGDIVSKLNCTEVVEDYIGNCLEMIKKFAKKNNVISYIGMPSGADYDSLWLWLGKELEVLERPVMRRRKNIEFQERYNEWSTEEFVSGSSLVAPLVSRGGVSNDTIRFAGPGDYVPFYRNLMEWNDTAATRLVLYPI